MYICTKYEVTGINYVNRVMYMFDDSANKDTDNDGKIMFTKAKFCLSGQLAINEYTLLCKLYIMLMQNVA